MNRIPTGSQVLERTKALAAAYGHRPTSPRFLRAEQLLDEVTKIRSLYLHENYREAVTQRALEHGMSSSAAGVVSMGCWAIAKLLRQPRAIYFWTDEMWKLAAESGLSYPCPDDLVWSPEMLGVDPSAAGIIYWGFQTDREIPGTLDTEATVVATLLAVVPPSGFDVIELVADNQGGLIVPCTKLKACYGERVAVATRSDNAQDAKAEVRSRSQFAGMLAFLASPYIGTLRLSVSRAMRRRRVREQLPVVEDPMVVVLRRAQAKRRTDVDEAVEIDWSHQWLVRGHWRNQWYPSTEQHEPTWIAPHIKGPEDKPLILRAEQALFSVER